MTIACQFSYLIANLPVDLNISEIECQYCHTKFAPPAYPHRAIYLGHLLDRQTEVIYDRFQLADPIPCPQCQTSITTYVEECKEMN